MKICPVKVEIEYVSGGMETETITLIKEWEKWKIDLKRGVELGIIKSYTKEDEQDRLNKKQLTH